MKNQQNNTNLVALFKKSQIKGAIKAKFDHGEIDLERYRELMNRYRLEIKKDK